MEDNTFKLNEYYEERNDTDLSNLSTELDNIYAQGGEISTADQFMAQNKKPNPAMEGAMGAASGAAAGAAFGPWGAAIGGVIGGASGVIKGIAGGKEYESQLSEARTSDNDAGMAYEADSTNFSSTQGGTQMIAQGQYADGGEIDPPTRVPSWKKALGAATAVTGSTAGKVLLQHTLGDDTPLSSVAKSSHTFTDDINTVAEKGYPSVEFRGMNEVGYDGKGKEIINEPGYTIGGMKLGTTARLGLGAIHDALGDAGASVGGTLGKFKTMTVPDDNGGSYEVATDIYNFKGEPELEMNREFIPYSHDGSGLTRAEGVDIINNEDFQDRAMLDFYNSAVDPEKQFGNQKAQGGDIGIPNSLQPNEPNAFNNGGTHEQNPLGGIPQGVGTNGKPNLVEEGEVSFMYKGKKLIISNRM